MQFKLRLDKLISSHYTHQKTERAGISCLTLTTLQVHSSSIDFTRKEVELLVAL